MEALWPRSLQFKTYLASNIIYIQNSSDIQTDLRNYTVLSPSSIPFGSDFVVGPSRYCVVPTSALGRNC